MCIFLLICFNVNMMQPNNFFVHLFHVFAQSFSVVLCHVFCFVNDLMVVVVVVVVVLSRFVCVVV